MAMQHSFGFSKGLRLTPVVLISLVVVGFAHAATDAPRFSIQGDTIYDTKTGLTWQRCSVGRQWVERAGCVGRIKVMTFEDAQRQGDATWRVPTKEELASLIDRNKGAQGQKPTIDEMVFPDMSLDRLWYWTSTPSDPSLAYYVDFHAGFTYYGGYRSDTNAVRLVRGGQ
jgi:hypothetical protein